MLANVQSDADLQYVATKQPVMTVDNDNQSAALTVTPGYQEWNSKNVATYFAITMQYNYFVCVFFLRLSKSKRGRSN